MFCSNCGSEVSEDAKFCSTCGKQVETADVVSKTVSEDNDIDSKSMNKGLYKRVFLVTIGCIGLVISLFLLYGKDTNDINSVVMVDGKGEYKEIENCKEGGMTTHTENNVGNSLIQEKTKDVSNEINKWIQTEINDSECKIYSQNHIMNIPVSEKLFWEASYAGYDEAEEKDFLRDIGYKVEINKELELAGLERVQSSAEMYASVAGIYPKTEVMIHNDVQSIHVSYKGKRGREIASAGYDYDTHKVTYFSEDLSEVDEYGNPIGRFTYKRTIRYDKVTGEAIEYTLTSRQASKDYSETEALNNTRGEVIYYEREIKYSKESEKPISSVYSAWVSDDSGLCVKVEIIYDSEGRLHAIGTYDYDMEESVYYLVSDEKWFVGNVRMLEKGKLQ